MRATAASPVPSIAFSVNVDVPTTLPMASAPTRLLRRPGVADLDRLIRQPREALLERAAQGVVAQHGLDVLREAARHRIARQVVDQLVARCAAAPSIRRTAPVGGHRHADRLADHAAERLRHAPAPAGRRRPPTGLALSYAILPVGVFTSSETASIDLAQRRACRPRIHGGDGQLQRLRRASARTSPGRAAPPVDAAGRPHVGPVGEDVPLLPLVAQRTRLARAPARRRRQHQQAQRRHGRGSTRFTRGSSGKRS